MEGIRQALSLGEQLQVGGGDGDVHACAHRNPADRALLGKVFLFGAAIQNGFLWLAVVGIVNSVVSLYYYVGVIRAMWQLPPGGAVPAAGPAGSPMDRAE